ncbi:MAG: GyrI-like domain-containing protein [Lachnospiraceae bacterium]
MEEKDSTTIRSAMINQAISYIFAHIDEDISVDDVANHCGYSKYHLMRLFREDMDEALYQFIKRVRLERSAWKLKVEKSRSVTDIGIEYGYSASNFATAFKKHLNVSPTDFRRTSEKLVEQSSFSHGISLDDIEDSGKRITIEYLDPMLVICERKKGNYHNLPAEWCKFIEKYSYLASGDTLYIECTIDDPSITDEDSCMYELCQTIPSNHPALMDGSALFTHMFGGGKYAVYHFKGFPQFLFMVYQEVFCRWLSRTGNQLDERPILDIYRHVGEDGYMEIDICFPIQ